MGRRGATATRRGSTMSESKTMTHSTPLTVTAVSPVIDRILEYSMEGGDVPTGVTIPDDPRVSSGEAWAFTPAGAGQVFVRLEDGTWETL